MTASRDFLTDSILPTETTENIWIQIENNNKKEHIIVVQQYHSMIYYYFCPLETMLLWFKSKMTVTYESAKLRNCETVAVKAYE